MEPTSFDEENMVLNPPTGVSERDCSSLSVFANGDVVISCWKPTKEELAEINKTGRVWLLIHGVSMPPVIVSGITPFVRDSEK